MDIFVSLLKLLGGLVLLIYGMNILSTNLKKLSGGKLEKILLEVTNNAFKGLLVGFVITFVTHSSAATTVIVVGLVGAGILSLKNAIPIIMGANIGTTMNSQILRLAGVNSDSILRLLTPECFAPVLLIVGFLITQKAKKQKTKDIGSMVMGLGLLFTGMMSMMSIASSFSDLPILASILKSLSNPLLGVLAGCIVTAIVQSSSATIGILQALSTTGIITYSTVIPIVLGQNIGTCVTSILASVGGNTNSKRVAAIHLYFNLIGTIIFLIGIYSYQSLVGFSFWNDSINMGRIADFHTIFNVVSTIILFPFIGLLEKLAIITVRDKKDDKDDDGIGEADHLIVLNGLDEKFINIPSLALKNSITVIDKMAEISEANFKRSVNLVEEFDKKILEKVQTREDNIDKMEEEVTKYLVNLESLDLSNHESLKVSTLLNIESEFEKMGDYAYRLSKIAENIEEKDIEFSKAAKKELNVMYELTEIATSKAIKMFKTKNLNIGVEIEALRQFVEYKRDEYKNIHIDRLKNGKCNVESGIAFIEILNICDSIVNHCVNISMAMYNYKGDKKQMSKHEFRKDTITSNRADISHKLKYYKKKYRTD
ncbi:MAG: Na/Pi cotransporter family protein [Bacilli bacterium]|nr:Na/Pi cotransporter family protein [Bacilli bacterium]